MTMALTVPANAAATVRLPASAPSSVREGGAVAATGSGRARRLVGRRGRSCWRWGAGPTVSPVVNAGTVADCRYEVQTAPAGGVCPLTR